MMLPRISASAEADPLQHTLRNWCPAQLQPNGVRAPPASAARLPAGLGLSQPAQQDHTPSPRRGQQPGIQGRVSAPRGPVAIPVSHVWASTKLPAQLVQNPAIPPLSPFYFLPYPFPVARIQPCKLTFCDKYACTLWYSSSSITYTC